jgi:hypothetical protein
MPRLATIASGNATSRRRDSQYHANVMNTLEAPSSSVTRVY